VTGPVTLNGFFALPLILSTVGTSIGNGDIDTSLIFASELGPQLSNLKSALVSILLDDSKYCPCVGSN
jgi:hypothetical protein